MGCADSSLDADRMMLRRGASVETNYECRLVWRERSDVAQS